MGIQNKGNQTQSIWKFVLKCSNSHTAAWDFCRSVTQKWTQNQQSSIVTSRSCNRAEEDQQQPLPEVLPTIFSSPPSAVRQPRPALRGTHAQSSLAQAAAFRGFPLELFANYDAWRNPCNKERWMHKMRQEKWLGCNCGKFQFCDHCMWTKAKSVKF